VLCLLALLLGLPSIVRAEPTAQQRHIDRLAILVEEHKSITRQLAEAQMAEPPRTDDIRMLQVSLEALNKEIAYVRKQPVYEDKSGMSEGRAAQKPARQAKAPPAGSQAANLRFDGWDVFHNFGRDAKNDKTE
jgi:hypothetical protein